MKRFYGHRPAPNENVPTPAHAGAQTLCGVRQGDGFPCGLPIHVVWVYRTSYTADQGSPDLVWRHTGRR